MPSVKAPQGRKAWSIDLESTWLPFFTATNIMGDTAIPSDALGAPLRLAFDKDGSVRFNRNGRPITRLAKPISQAVSLVRENFVATLKDYAHNVAESQPEGYSAQIALQREAGEPIIQYERAEMDKAIQLQMAQAMAEAINQTSQETEAETPTPDPVKERELVTA